MRRLFAGLMVMMLALSLALGGAARADAAVEAAGYSDFLYNFSGVSAPTGEKPQSKLWFNDGRWWGSLFNRSAGTYHIYWLDTSTQVWIDSGVELDSRPNTQADCLWDAAAGKLYIASGGASTDARLYRYSYNATNKSYSRDASFPVTIRSGGAETIVLDKDSIGRLWVTYTKSSQVYVNYSNGSDNTWAGPMALNVSGTKSAVSSDDISSLITVNNRVIVLWSNQTDRTFYYAIHSDADPLTSWAGGVAGRDPNGGALADDHINIKSLQSDAAGNIFAVVKTSFNSSSSSSPQIILLVAKRQTSGNGYTWQPPAMVSSGAENQTRAILLIDTDHRDLHVFTADESGGSIYHKQASIDNIQFPAGFGDRFIGSSTFTDINNPSSTKQTVNSSTGLAVIASDDTQDWYLHNYLSLGGTPPPADTTPPTVSGTTPASNATGISTAASVTASFSEALNASTVTSANFRLSGPSGAVAATVSYDSATRTATLAPSAALAAGASYTAQISGVKDLAGNTLVSAYTWSFTTAAAPPQGSSFTFAPAADTYVNQASPGSNYATSNQIQAVGGSSAKQMFIRFNVGGLPAGTGVSSAKLRLYVTNDSTSGGIVQSVSDTAWAENITWSTKPPIDGPVRATLGAIALNTAVEVDLGTAIAGNGSYSFAITLPSANTNTLAYASRENTTATSRPQLIVTAGGSAPADTTPPTVVSTTPSNAAGNVGTSASVTAAFSEALDASTVNTTSFTLSGPAGAVPASVSYNSASSSATLTPNAALAAGASYTAQISGVKDLAGNTLASAYTWSFTTAAAPPADTTPPTVASTSPADAASNVGTSTSVMATFSEALDASTVNAASFTLSGPAGAVPASVSYNGASSSATLTPNAALAAGASYTAQISGVKDLAGNTLASAYTWSFTTAAAPPQGSSFTFTPAADTFVIQNSTTTNATKSELQAVGGSTVKQIYIRFDVSGLPAGATVGSAKLRLYVSNDSSSGGAVQGVSNNSWPEALTWAAKPQLDGPVYATLGAVALNTTVEVDLGATIAGNGSYSFAITLPANVTNTVGYASREVSTIANRPQLVITTQ